MIIWLISSWLCALIILTLGIFALKTTGAMWFWTGTTVDVNTITNLKEYNKENAYMWIIYSLIFFISGLNYNDFGIILILLACFPGIVILVLNYKRIEKKYIKK